MKKTKFYSIFLLLFGLCWGQTTFATSRPEIVCPTQQNFLSTTTLVQTRVGTSNKNDRECAIEEIKKRKLAPFIWAGLLKQANPKIRSMARSNLTNFSSIDLLQGKFRASKKGINFPFSAMPTYIQSSVNAFSANSLAARMPYVCGSDMLVQLSDVGETLIQSLVKSMSSKVPEVREVAIDCLGALGPQAKSAVPHLISYMLLEIKGKRAPSNAMISLSKIGVYTMADFDKIKDMGGRYRPIGSKQFFIALPPEIVPTLTKLVQRVIDKDREDATQLLSSSEFYAEQLDWVINDLASTRSADAVELLIQAGQYHAIELMGSTATPVLIDRLGKTKNLNEKVIILKTLMSIQDASAQQAMENALTELLPTMIAGIKQNEADALDELDSESPNWNINFLSSANQFQILGNLARQATKSVLPMLHSQQAEQRIKAARVLGWIHAFEAEPILMSLHEKIRVDKADEDAISHKEKRAMEWAIADLRNASGYMKAKTTSALISDATDPNYEKKEDAIRELSHRKPDGAMALIKVLDVWRSRYHEEDDHDSEYIPGNMLQLIFDQFADMGNELKAVSAQLVSYLNDPVIARELGSPYGKAYLPYLDIRTDDAITLLYTQIVNNENVKGRWYSAQVLGEMGDIPPQMKDTLIKFIEKKAIWELESSAPDALVYALTGQHVNRSVVANDTPAVPVVPDLIKQLISQGQCKTKLYSNAPDKSTVCEELKKEGKPAVLALQALLQHPNKRLRHTVCDLLGDMGSSAQIAIPQLNLLLHDADHALRKVAADNMGRIIKSAKDAPYLANFLLKTLANKAIDDRYWAALQLSSLGDLPVSSVTQLQVALTDPHLQDAQELLLSAIANTHTLDGSNVLLAYLQTSDTQVKRDNVTHALKRIGTVAIHPLLQQSRISTDPDQLISLADVLIAQNQEEVKREGTAIIDRLLPQLAEKFAKPDSKEQWHLESRRHAARQIARLLYLTPKVQVLAKRMMTDPDPYIRIVGITAIGQTAQTDLLPALQVAQQDRNDQVRYYAERAHASVLFRNSTYRRWKACVNNRESDPIALAMCRGDSLDFPIFL